MVTAMMKRNFADAPLFEVTPGDAHGPPASDGLHLLAGSCASFKGSAQGLSHWKGVPLLQILGGR